MGGRIVTAPPRSLVDSVAVRGARNYCAISHTTSTVRLSSWVPGRTGAGEAAGEAPMPDLYWSYMGIGPDEDGISVMSWIRPSLTPAALAICSACSWARWTA